MPRYQPVPEDPQVSARPDVPDGRPTPSPPPLARKRSGREQFNTQILPALRRLLDEFVEANGYTYQGVVEEALKEYLKAWGVDVSSAEEPRERPR